MKIQKVGIIGAGNMGNGIAQKIAQEDISVVLVDIEDRLVQRGIENIKKTLSKAVERKIFDQVQTNEIINRITGTTDRNEVRDADIIIEAIFEDMDIKKNLFKYWTCHRKWYVGYNLIVKRDLNL